MNYINREMEKTLREAWRYFSVLTVTGPRQSGKSILLKHLFPEAVTVAVDNLNRTCVLGYSSIDIQVVQTFDISPSQLHPEGIDDLGHIRDFRILSDPVVLDAQGWINKDELLDFVGIVTGIKGRHHAALAYSKQGDLSLLYSLNIL